MTLPALRIQLACVPFRSALPIVDCDISAAKTYIEAHPALFTYKIRFNNNQQYVISIRNLATELLKTARQ